MPIIKSAKKKLKVDRKREAVNKPVKSRMKTAVKEVRKSPSKESLQAAYSAVDKAVKQKLITKSKAARIKSRLVAFLRGAVKKSPFAK